MTTTPMGLASVPDPEVPARAQRRKYGARYKARILGEYERLESTERGVLLSREGLYSSHISKLSMVIESCPVAVSKAGSGSSFVQQVWVRVGARLTKLTI